MHRIRIHHGRTHGRAAADAEPEDVLDVARGERAERAHRNPSEAVAYLRAHDQSRIECRLVDRAVDEDGTRGGLGKITIGSAATSPYKPVWFSGKTNRPPPWTRAMDDTSDRPRQICASASVGTRTSVSALIHTEVEAYVAPVNAPPGGREAARRDV